MLLLIDAGNTRTKWGVVNDRGEITRHDARMNPLLSDDDFSHLQPLCHRAIISNVAGDHHAERLTKLLGSTLALEWFKSSTKAGNITNHYRHPESLGCDRWAALIAAWHIQHATTVVINAGTAITIDALVQNPTTPTQGDFVGGMILPGLNLMQTSLGLAGAQLPQKIADRPLTNTIFGTTTDEAILAGTLNAAVGAIHQMVNKVQQAYKTLPKIIISGGDANLIASSLTDLKTEIIIEDHLVMRGLYLSSLTSQK